MDIDVRVCRRVLESAMQPVRPIRRRDSGCGGLHACSGVESTTRGARIPRRSQGSLHCACSTLKKIFSEAVVDSTRAGTIDARSAFGLSRVATRMSFWRSSSGVVAKPRSRTLPGNPTSIGIRSRRSKSSVCALTRPARTVALVAVLRLRELSIYALMPPLPVTTGGR
jgi:hypothetical protein